MYLVLLALAAGALTVLAPCILPLLPIILGGTQGGGRTRPIWVVVGFVVSFSLVGALLATVGTFLGLSSDTLRKLAVGVLVILGVMLVFPALYTRLQVKLERVMTSFGQRLMAGAGQTRAGGLLVGVAMGFVWTPCAGPVLGSILTLAATSQDALTTGWLLLAYSVGAALPMLAIAYAGRRVVQWFKHQGGAVVWLNRAFGLLLILAALAIWAGLDRTLQTLLLPYLPSFVLL